MNRSYEYDSTPKPFNRSKYIESVMDFSTPMSTISTRWMMNNSQLKNSIDDNNVYDQLLRKLHEYKVSFYHTKNYLHLLDIHLHGLTKFLNQEKCLSDSNSLLRTILQMSVKLDYIRKAMNYVPQSPKLVETIQKMIEDIRNISVSSQTSTVRTDDYYTKLQQRQELLLELADKIVEQQKFMEKANLNKPKFDNHNERLVELQKLTDEYQSLQDENRLLKNKIKANIQILNIFIN